MDINQTSNSLELILKHRQQDFGSFCKIAGKASELSLACQTQPMIDERLMSARAIINTPREDREGDVIEPAGVQLENFRNNPIVLWEHGLGEITRPIAKCQHPDGRLAIEVDQEKISATSYFTSKSLESLQIFHLISEGLVRATSVRALPIKTSTRKTANSGIGIVLKQWELIEWSWGALGVNPDAIARTLDRGTIEGHKIVEPLLKSLRTVLPQKKHQIPGWTLKDTNHSMEKEHEVDEMQAQIKVPEDNMHQLSKLPKLLGDQRVLDSNSREYSSDQSQKISISNPESDSDLVMSVPLGAQILKSISCCFLDLKDHVRSTAAVLENERIESFLEKLLLTLASEQTKLEKTFADNYTQLELKDENMEVLGKRIKSDSNFHLVNFPGMGEIAYRLKRIGSKNYSESALKAQEFSDHQCQQIADVLIRTNLLSQQKIHSEENQLLDNVEELSRVVKNLQQQVSNLLPQT
ncbi:hypothetical protein [Gimesia algae]|uniref:hypothetical protein n=1 Tax=Gimesia algae TaxID=2527971 RepID=UPI0011A28485|nr:hypothetical protein [Gimesia algae]